MAQYAGYYTRGVSDIYNSVLVIFIMCRQQRAVRTSTNLLLRYKYYYYWYIYNMADENECVCE